jgi:hypothetical protein
VPDSQTWTYEDVVSIGQAVTNPENNTWGVRFSDHNWGECTGLGHVRSSNGEFLSEDGREVLIGLEPTNKTWQMMYDWIHTWKIAPPPAVRDEQNPTFGGGLVAMTSRWIARPGYGQEEQNLEAVQMLPPINPETGQRFSCSTGGAQVVTAWAQQRGNEEAAYHVVQNFSSVEFDRLKIEFKVGQEPAHLSVMQEEAFAPEETRAVLAEANQYHIKEPYWPWNRSIESSWAWYTIAQEAFTALWKNEISFNEAMARITEGGNDALRDAENTRPQNC